MCMHMYEYIATRAAEGVGDECAGYGLRGRACGATAAAAAAVAAGGT